MHLPLAAQVNDVGNRSVSYRTGCSIVVLLMPAEAELPSPWQSLSIVVLSAAYTEVNVAAITLQFVSALTHSLLLPVTAHDNNDKQTCYNIV